MKNPKLMLSALALGSILIGAAHAQQAPFMVSMPATSNLFYAGTVGLTPPTSNCTSVSGLGDGTLPPSLPLPPGARAVQFYAFNTTPITYGIGNPVPTPDGSVWPSSTITTALNPSGTMPGLQLLGRYGMLAAVFLDDSPVSLGGAASAITYTPADMNAPAPSYGLKVPFFMGDGSVVDFATFAGPPSTPSGSEQRQTFAVPAGATRIFFGLADAPSVWGNNSCYMDNSGAIQIEMAMAVADDHGTATAGSGGTAIADVRANDFMSGLSPTALSASLSPVGTWTAGITLNPSTGAVNVGAGVAPGTYTGTYRLCDIDTSPQSCLDAETSVVVTGALPPPVAVPASSPMTLSLMALALLGLAGLRRKH